MAMPKKEIEKRVRQLWRENRPHNPTGFDMFKFFSKLQRENPELTVWHRVIEPWQSIHSWLIDEERKLKRKSQQSKT